jgi:hypothetical protein
MAVVEVPHNSKAVTEKTTAAVTRRRLSPQTLRQGDGVDLQK